VAYGNKGIFRYIPADIVQIRKRKVENKRADNDCLNLLSLINIAAPRNFRNAGILGMYGRGLRLDGVAGLPAFSLPANTGQRSAISGPDQNTDAGA